MNIVFSRFLFYVFIYAGDVKKNCLKTLQGIK